MDAVFETDLMGVKRTARGKVRDIYDLGDKLLIVATDRLSAFDYVFPNPVPDKGKVLNQISDFWFERLKDVVPNHVISTNVDEYPEPLRSQPGPLRGRSTLARKLNMLPVECVARGYLSGSGWKEYQKQGTVCGIPLPEGLRESDALPEPIFTPATKATDGHDENIPFERMVEIVGESIATRARDLTLQIYREGAAYARTKDIIIADTKFEFGTEGDNEDLILADEVLTPDSSRFWPSATYEPGRGQPSLDKQYVRDWAESVGWNKQPPVPEIPEDIVAGARARYLAIFERLTDRTLEL